MVVAKVLRVLALLAFIINWHHVESEIAYGKFPDANNEVLVVRDKRAVDPLSVIGLVVSVASAIQSAICTFSEVCGGDKITPKLEKMEKKLNAIQSDVTSIKRDVEEIWAESKRKWYFKHIDNVVQQRKDVIRDLKKKDYSKRAKDKQQRFINEVFGGTGNDEYVEKALFHIPTLVTKEGLVTHYFKVQTQNGKSAREAARLTWIFIRKLFRYQEDGYASIVFAASMKYKNDEASFNSTMSQVCKWWPKSKDPEYEKFCSKFVKDPYSEDRRKPQQDLLFALRDLVFVPVQLVKTDCSKFADSDALFYSTGYLYVAQPAAKKILIVNPATLDIVKTIDVPGSECGGNCHPFGVTIDAKHNLLAIAVQSKLSGGESKIMLFKIKGNLEAPNGISIERYFTIHGQLMQADNRKPDVRGVAFCGGRFAYADYNGAIYNWKMPPNKLYMGWNNGKLKPDWWSRIDWSLRREYNYNNGHQYYFGCSNSGKDFVVEKIEGRGYRNGVGAVPSDSKYGSDKILEMTEIKVTKRDWYDVPSRDRRSRMNQLRGIAMDSKRNLFYSSESGRMYYDRVSGVYQRTYDGKRRYIREWNKDSKVQMFGMAVDDSGFLFSVQKLGSGRKCLYKFHHEIDLEDINVA